MCVSSLDKYGRRAGVWVLDLYILMDLAILAWEMESENTNSSTLSDKQRARIERNRQRAILLRNARLASHPYSTKKSENDAVSDGLGQPYSTRLIDTGGGFLLDPEEHNEAQKEINIVFEPGKVPSIF